MDWWTPSRYIGMVAINEQRSGWQIASDCTIQYARFHFTGEMDENVISPANGKFIWPVLLIVPVYFFKIIC